MSALFELFDDRHDRKARLAVYVLQGFAFEPGHAFERHRSEDPPPDRASPFDVMQHVTAIREAVAEVQSNCQARRVASDLELHDADLRGAWLSVPEAAQVLRVSRRVVMRRLLRGQLRGRRVGIAWRVHCGDL